MDRELLRDAYNSNEQDMPFIKSVIATAYKEQTGEDIVKSLKPDPVLKNMVDRLQESDIPEEDIEVMIRKQGENPIVYLDKSECSDTVCENADCEPDCDNENCEPECEQSECEPEPVDTEPEERKARDAKPEPEKEMDAEPIDVDEDPIDVDADPEPEPLTQPDAEAAAQEDTQPDAEPTEGTLLTDGLAAHGRFWEINPDNAAEVEVAELVSKKRKSYSGQEMLDAWLKSPYMVAQHPFGAKQSFYACEDQIWALPLSVWHEILDATRIDEIEWDADTSNCGKITALGAMLIAIRYKVNVLWFDSISGNHSWAVLPVVKKDGSLGYQSCELQIDKMISDDELRAEGNKYDLKIGELHAR